MSALPTPEDFDNIPGAGIYGRLPIRGLRNELKKRKLSTTGSQVDLIQRLVHNDLDKQDRTATKKRVAAEKATAKAMKKSPLRAQAAASSSSSAMKAPAKAAVLSRPSRSAASSSSPNREKRGRSAKPKEKASSPNREKRGRSAKPKEKASSPRRRNIKRGRPKGNDDDVAETEGLKRGEGGTDIDELLERAVIRSSKLTQNGDQANPRHLAPTRDTQFVVTDMINTFYSRVVRRAASLCLVENRQKIDSTHIDAAFQFCIGGVASTELREAGSGRVEEMIDWKRENNIENRRDKDRRDKKT